MVYDSDEVNKWAVMVNTVNSASGSW